MRRFFSFGLLILVLAIQTNTASATDPRDPIWKFDCCPCSSVPAPILSPANLPEKAPEENDVSEGIGDGNEVE